MKKKKKLAGQSTPASVDLISNLLQDLLNSILVRLPIRDAVRTSILSKKWRYKWVSISDIVFDEDCLMKGALVMKRVNVVDQVLMHHVGPICKFSCTNYVPSSIHIDRWIVFLWRNGIRNFTFTPKDFTYAVPSSIFYCQELRHLELYNCILKVPPTFTGFPNLLVLNLFVRISEDDLAFLIAKCPLLERLKLELWMGILLTDVYKCLSIHAPNLRFFEFEGHFRDLSLGSSPFLTDVTMHSVLTPSYWNIRQHCNTCNLVQFNEYWHGVERLVLKGFSLQFLVVGVVPEKLYATYDHLKFLEINIELNSKEIFATLCILRSSPNLEELKINYYVSVFGKRSNSSREEAEFWGAKIQFDGLLSHLHALEITGFALLSDLVLLRYIFSSAPVLETVRVYVCNYLDEDEVLRITEELLGLDLASTRAECNMYGRSIGKVSELLM